MPVVSESEWVREGSFEPIATLEMTVAQIAGRLGFEPMRYDTDGLGVAVGALFKDRNNEQYLIEQLLEAPNEWAARTNIHVQAFDIVDGSAKRRTPQRIEKAFIDAMRDLRMSAEYLVWINEIIKTDDRLSLLLGCALPVAAIQDLLKEEKAKKAAFLAQASAPADPRP